MGIFFRLYVLSECYDTAFCITEENVGACDATEIIGWRNGLFGEQCTNAHIHHLWEIYMLLPEDHE